MGIANWRGFDAVLVTSEIWKWLLRLGGPGLIIVGLMDSSAIPTPGSMDVFVVLLTAHHPEWWPYYGAMATIGSVLGGWLTYRLAQKGGKAGLEKKIGKKRSQRVYKKFEKGGFSSVLIGSILPPPFPLVPVLMAAGVMQYSRNKFLAALTIGRTKRFFSLAFLGRLYETAIAGWLSRYYKPFLYVLISVGIAGGVGALLHFKWYRPGHQPTRETQNRKAA
jgi:membrane protein YqaA with SNARE-associated domain